MKTLSDNIIGCERCLGSWIPTKKVQKSVAELKENICCCNNVKKRGLGDKCFSCFAMEKVFGGKLSK